MPWNPFLFVTSSLRSSRGGRWTALSLWLSEGENGVEVSREILYCYQVSSAAQNSENDEVGTDPRCRISQPRGALGETRGTYKVGSKIEAGGSITETIEL